jgi:hypothetical protein
MGVALITGAVVALDSRQPRHLFKRGPMLLLLDGVKQNSNRAKQLLGKNATAVLGSADKCD